MAMMLRATAFLTNVSPDTVASSTAILATLTCAGRCNDAFEGYIGVLIRWASEGRPGLRGETLDFEEYPAPGGKSSISTSRRFRVSSNSTSYRFRVSSNSTSYRKYCGGCFLEIDKYCGGCFVEIDKYCGGCFVEFDKYCGRGFFEFGKNRDRPYN